MIPPNHKGEVYTVLLRSGDRESGDLQTATFMVNWEHVLPKDTEKYILKAFFRANAQTNNANADSLDVIFIKASGVSPCLWDSDKKGQSNIISTAVLYQSQYVLPDNAVSYGFISLTNDIEGLMVNRPTCQDITISIEDNFGDGVTVTNGWFLWLQFYPIR